MTLKSGSIVLIKGINPAADGRLATIINDQHPNPKGVLVEVYIPGRGKILAIAPPTNVELVIS